MKLFAVVFAVFTLLVSGQIPLSHSVTPAPPPAPPPSAKPQPSQTESADLQKALEEAGPSPIDFVRAIENHLAKYPDSVQRADLERALAKGAIEAKDERRIALYGERVLARDQSDPEMLEDVAVAELKTHDAGDARKALGHAQRLEQVARDAAAQFAKNPPAGRDGARQKVQSDYRLSRALVLEARAQATLGDSRKAVDLAIESYGVMPSAEAAREAAARFEELHDYANAARWMADAFTVADPRVSENERNADRDRLGEIWREWKGSQAGLGELVLTEWDRNRDVVAQRRLALRQFDPNMQMTDPMEFTLSGADGTRLKLASLRGKVIVMDFWATWCGPCRVQHPLYEKVQEKYRGRDDVVFLFIDTDDDHSGVSGFLASNKWTGKVYYEDGLSTLLRVSSIPTTLVFDPHGELASRMTGFDPDRFERMLSERIDDALKKKVTAAVRERP